MAKDDGTDGSNDTLGWTGNWWLPSNPDERLPGVLFPAGDRGPAVELFGSFHPGGKDMGPLEIVHGTTSKAEYVTLYNLKASSAAEDARGVHQIRYDAELAVTGEHFPSPESLAFQEIRIHYSTLVRWIAQPLIDAEALRGRTSSEKVVRMYPPIQQAMHRGDGCTLDLNYQACYEMTGSGTTLNLYPGAYITLRWDSPRPLSNTLVLVGAIRDFLAFATCLPTNVEELRGQFLRTTRIGHAHEVLLFHEALAAHSAEQEFHLPLFSFSDVTANLESVIGAWLQKGRTLQPVIDLHLSPTYNPQMRMEGQFLAAVQALEAFHRRMRNNRELSEEEHAARMHEVLAGVPANRKEWVRQRLSNSNEPGLRQRIRALFDEYADVLQGFAIDRDGFAKMADKTRGYLTHYNPYLEGKIASGWELYKLIDGLRLLPDICLLAECGVDRGIISRLVTHRHMGFSYGQ